MSSEPTSNGAKGSGSRERPDWYVPLNPVPDDGRTVLEVLLDTFGTEPIELPDDLMEEHLAYLDSFRVPRES